MKSKRVLIGSALVLTALVAGWFLLLGSGLGDAARGGNVKSVPKGDQEIAWVAPATGSDSWERLVSALAMMEKDWERHHGTPGLRVNLDKAFLNLTAAVPEIGLSFAEGGPTLWIRWYKLTGENTAAGWVEKLMQRGQPPLAVIGGETTDRALKMAQALKDARGKWGGADPLFLISTATADAISPEDDPNFLIPADKLPRLMDAYPDRTFRYSFTNGRMVEALIDFMQQNPHVCASTSSDPMQIAGMVAAGDSWACIGNLAAMGHAQPWSFCGVSWWDDGYSRDMINTFLRYLGRKVESRDWERVFVTNERVEYSAGGYQQVNDSEGRVVGTLLQEAATHDRSHFFLLLPTGSQRVRRFVSDLYRQAPLEARRFVVLTGDSISLNQVFRDRDTAWNVLEVPVPLVFFSHRLPADVEAGFDWKASEEELGAQTGTQDLLLHRDIIESLLLAAFDRDRLSGDADTVMAHLRETVWSKGRVHNPRVKAPEGNPNPESLFTAEGNRRPGTGEHIVWVQPLFEKDRVRTARRANISIWGTNARDIHRWHIRPKAALPVLVTYNQPGPESVLLYRRLDSWIVNSSAHRMVLTAPRSIEVEPDDGE